MPSLRETLDQAAQVPDPSSTVPMPRRVAVAELASHERPSRAQGSFGIEDPLESPVGARRETGPSTRRTKGSVPWLAIVAVLGGLAVGGFGVVLLGVVVGLLALL